MKFKVVRRKGSHFNAAYLTEAIGWSRAIESRNWEKKLPKLAYLQSAKIANVKATGYFFKCFRQLDECYDTSVPFVNRLRLSGKMVERLSELAGIDKELLLLAAIARWLARTRSFNLAVLVMARYEGICLQLSEGQNRDTLGLLQNLMDNAWCKNTDRAEQVFKGQ